MNERMILGDSITTNIIRTRGNVSALEIVGTYRLEHFRAGQLIGKYEFKNLVTTEGKRHLLTLGYTGTGTQVSPWYIALVNNDNGTKNGGSGDDPPRSPVAGQVYDTFFDTQNTEYTDYTGGATSGDRIAWVETLDGSLATITNAASKAVFTFVTNPGTLYGACLVSRQSKSDHDPAGILMSYSAFTPSTISVLVSDVVNVEVEISFTT